MIKSDGHYREKRRTSQKVLFVVAFCVLQLLGLVDAVADYSYTATQFPDVVVAGGLDGRVYAVNAWSGKILWSFDSGGPMVDSSRCVGVNPTTSPDIPPNYQSAAGKPDQEAKAKENVEVDGSVHVVKTRADNYSEENWSVVQQQTAAVANTAFISRLVPSYDGRFYYVSKSKVKELEVTMADIANMNGPVRVAEKSSVNTLATDILLFGEKKMEIFALDVVSGFRRSYSSSSASGTSTEILLGRSDFLTRAIHPRNVSNARCFKISEFFLDFSQQARCSVDDSSRRMVPEIIVLPKDPNYALEDEGSTIVAFDPWTNEQLWEFEIPNFDVLAVYGVSTLHGSAFYNWKVKGPSSTSSRHVQNANQVTAWNSRSNQRSIVSSSFLQPTSTEEQNRKNSLVKQPLVRVMPRTWGAIESRYRLRLLGDSYFLESSAGDGVTFAHDTTPVNFGSPTFHGRPSSDANDYHGGKESPCCGRSLWEPIVNNGKPGVFITYTHVGAMLLGVATCGILLAWGCYFKGLSASIAQSAIKTMDQSQFFASRVHRLVIQRPGMDDITISSVFSRPLMINALGLDNNGLLLESSDTVSVLSTEMSTNTDLAAETLLMERFSCLAANEAAAILLNGKHVGEKQKFLEEAESNATTSLSSSSSLTDVIVRNVSTSSSVVQISCQESSLASSRLALPYPAEENLLDKDIPAVYKVLPAVGEAEADCECHERFELADSDDDTFNEGNISTTTMNGAKSISSTGESTTGSYCSNSNSSSSRGSSGGDEMEFTGEAKTGDNKFIEAKSSAQESCESSSSESVNSSNEAEALFPFVCQSRFVNEFEELSAIGKGGFGQVMLAQNRLDGRKYAIKRVGLNLKNQTSKTLQKFLREVKILALLDHPNIVRYYQAWLEKVEISVKEASVAPSSAASDRSSAGSIANAKTYSTSNLLAPISELEFSVNQRRLGTFYSNGSKMSDNDVDDGFEWERGSSTEFENDNGWKEEDVVVQNEPPSRISSSRSNPGARGNDDDSTLNAMEKCDHWLYIQMQYCAGRNLADYLAVPTRPMGLSRMLKIFVQIASALAHVHSCGLIHRDLKPANIFVADVEKDEIKLGDFGLSRYAANVSNPLNTSANFDDQQGLSSSDLRETPSSTSMWSNVSESNEVTAGVGTYLYASPEQVAGKKYNAKTDIYSLGMILFELCHEQFGTTMERYITLRNARDSKFPTDLLAAKRCPELLDMLRKLLSHNPTTRPTASEVVQWGQMMYESSLAQKAMEIVRSPRSLDTATSATSAYPFLPSIDHLMADVGGSFVTSTFSLKVEAAMEHCSGEDGGERRLPNHNLLKEVCDVIADIHNGKVEIKKCGLHMESEGVTILEFELDPQGALADAPDSDVAGSVVMAIEALSGVHIVHRVSKID
ncbi:hypothetical protein PsorP6_001392 [Peronosclerospora sorghi]|uniref:Uncharacterized protein n=1 Tax=Peronosclerospora sorghi TaxID=230839 RepID=A0ACC0WV04_9STRA|nr:hypothetical protein PsorP6_001392 [Peronosclerospora sorghi]